MSDDPAQLQPGTVVAGRYRVEGTLGQGGIQAPRASGGWLSADGNTVVYSELPTRRCVRGELLSRLTTRRHPERRRDAQRALPFPPDHDWLPVRDNTLGHSRYQACEGLGADRLDGPVSVPGAAPSGSTGSPNGT